jgi:uncharacterized membrane protein YfcA
MVTTFDALILVVGLAAGAVAGVAGFGVGSLLTPLLTLTVDGKVAVALVAIPHALATALRLWHLRHEVVGRVLRNFGVLSAIGGLLGGALYTQSRGRILEQILGGLLILVGALHLSGAARRVRIGGAWAWIAGGVSGLFGGLVGNQGGLRTAALLSFDLPPRALVATGAAIALIIDVVRLPFYLWESGDAVMGNIRMVAIATVAVCLGTFAGTAILLRLSAVAFGRLIGAVLLLLGLWLLVGSS